MLSNPNYKVGRVYRIICTVEPTIQYIGSTFNELRHRWQKHKQAYDIWIKGNNNNGTVTIYPYFKKYGIQYFKIILIKEYTVYVSNNKDHKHLMVYEQLWINKTVCINKNQTFRINFLSRKKTIVCKCSDIQFRIDDKQRHNRSDKHRYFLKHNKRVPKIPKAGIRIKCICSAYHRYDGTKDHVLTINHLNYVNKPEPNLIFID